MFDYRYALVRYVSDRNSSQEIITMIKSKNNPQKKLKNSKKRQRRWYSKTKIMY